MKNLFICCLPILFSCSAPQSQVISQPSETKEPKQPSTATAQSPASGNSIADLDFKQLTVIYQPPAPSFPKNLNLSRGEGLFIVEMTINPKGEVDSAKVLSGIPELTDCVETWARKWRFSPALLNGVPQYARFKLNMPFRLK